MYERVNRVVERDDGSANHNQNKRIIKTVVCDVVWFGIAASYKQIFMIYLIWKMLAEGNQRCSYVPHPSIKCINFY